MAAKIPAHPGETYTFGFDFAPYLAKGDRAASVVSVAQLDKLPADAPDCVIGLVGLDSSGMPGAEITVPADAAVGTKYTFRCLADSARGANLRLDGVLEVV